MIGIGADGAHLHICPGSHLYTKYHQSRKELLSRALKLEEIKIPPFSPFIGHKHLQHVGA